MTTTTALLLFAGPAAGAGLGAATMTTGGAATGSATRTAGTDWFHIILFLNNLISFK